MVATLLNLKGFHQAIKSHGDTFLKGTAPKTKPKNQTP
ncbi:uncharacterized protein METZ01_LOCUS113620 [marine metagenome]|uniref:Uncharacterized protein n=1 Tax=marine metagenome TaxID=408172 RepID=A0A381X7M4_9ZZZZ